MPALWRFFQPNRRAHGSFWFAWGSEQESAWRDNYRLWMAFVEDYKQSNDIGGDHLQIVDEPYIAKVGADLSRKLADITARRS